MKQQVLECDDWILLLQDDDAKGVMPLLMPSLVRRRNRCYSLDASVGVGSDCAR